LLVEADHVAGGIAETSRYLGRIGADGLHDLAAVDLDGIDSRGHAVNHDVNEQARL
jgi:hypothetical protein